MFLGGAVIGTMVIGQCMDDACGCRRRRFLSERGPMEDVDISSVAGAIAMAAATATAAAAIASGSSSDMLTEAIGS